MSRVLITPRSVTRNGHPALARLEAVGCELIFCTPGVQPDEAELLGLVPGCVGYLAGVEKISARVLDAAKDLKVIARNGAGIDNIDLEAARRTGVKIVPAAGANARGVAELTIALMLALARDVAFSDAQMKRTDWQRRRGIELRGRTLGIVGCGHIGQKVAALALALGMKVLAYDPYADGAFRPQGEFRYADLGEVFSASDVVSFHCPAPPDGKLLVTRESLATMRKGVYLINTARAGLLDEQALLEGLNDGHVAGLALDVFAVEPPGENALVRHDRVVATPHLGGYTTESIARAVEAAVQAILDHLP